MKSILHYFFSFLIWLTSCESETSSKQKEPDQSIVHDIARKLALKFKSEKDLQMLEFSIGSEIDPQSTDIGMFYDHDVEDIEKGRELLIYCIQESLVTIQAEEKLRPYLPDPFTEKNLYITITAGQELYLGERMHAYARNGYLCYSFGSWSEKDGSPKLKSGPPISETYQDALEYVNSKSHRPSILEVGVDTAEKFRSAHDLHLHFLSFKDEKALYFDCFHNIDHNGAREILLTCAHELLDALNSNEPASPIKLEDLYISVHVRHLNEDNPRWSPLETAPGKIWHFFLKEGVLYYNDQHNDPEREKSILEQSSSCQETYENAANQINSTEEKVASKP